MADSREELVGENDPNQPEDLDASWAAEDRVASVARDLVHVYDSDDADTADDEYHEARANLQAYGEMRKRKVKGRVDCHEEEVDQLDKFEEESEDEMDEEIDPEVEIGYP
ncbi:unnamed protein product [Linum trigynum]|uniref:Uncharacterized protein n=1 Tax=Linum trigynum TaxID=586398 RepID=A0AAV2ETR2_9ROSI